MSLRILKLALTGALLGACLTVPASADNDKVKTWTLRQAQPMKSRQGRLTARAPDLRPIVKSPFNGVVRVKNVGSATSGVSYVTVNCNRLGRRGGCPEARGMGPYENPAYPNRATIKVPKLKPGKTFTHKLKFWSSLSFGPGTYRFTVIADDGNKVAETNEGNNAAVTQLVVP